MKFRSVSTLFFACITAMGTLGFTTVASADPPHGHATVCATGCAYTSIQSALDAAAPGATITVGPGHYAENLVISKSVTLMGTGGRDEDRGGGATVLYPAFSAANPTPCINNEGSFCGADPSVVSNMILVQASNVSISNMVLEGDNPALSGGVNVGGANIDARNGIIEDWTQNANINNLTVQSVTVRDIFLRGIEAVWASGPGETFNFSHNIVTNVQGDPNSIAMFNSWGNGVMADNFVSGANDALSANWSTGTQFLDNRVTNSQSGIHTDNNGGNGGVADLIQGNSVSHCVKDGYGIWVFAPYVSPTVKDNKVQGCYVGLGLFGSQVSGQGPTFSGNEVNGAGATTSDPAGTYGAYVSTDLLGNGYGDATATFTGNQLRNSSTGLFVTQTSPNYNDPVGGHATVVASGNVIKGNGVGANGDPGTVLIASQNWWGCPMGPNAPGCDTAIGTTVFTPWLTIAPESH